MRLEALAAQYAESWQGHQEEEIERESQEPEILSPKHVYLHCRARTAAETFVGNLGRDLKMTLAIPPQRQGLVNLLEGSVFSLKNDWLGDVCTAFYQNVRSSHRFDELQAWLLFPSAHQYLVSGVVAALRADSVTGPTTDQNIWPSKVPPLVSEAVDLEATEGVDEALDYIYGEFDKLMWSEEFEVIDDTLASAPVEDLSIDIILALLTASLPVKANLSSRERLLQSAQLALESRGEFDDGLFDGL